MLASLIGAAKSKANSNPTFTDAHMAVEYHAQFGENTPI
jgi:hypothetical protein